MTIQWVVAEFFNNLTKGTQQRRNDMAQKVNIGSQPAVPPKPDRPSGQTGRKADRQARPLFQREIPRSLIIVIAVIVVGVLGAGVYYEVNGGWATQSQLRELDKHELGPLMAARHGNMIPLEHENARRKRLGLPLLQVPPSRQETAVQTRQKLQQLRQALEAKQGKQPAQSQ